MLALHPYNMQQIYTCVQSALEKHMSSDARDKKTEMEGVGGKKGEETIIISHDASITEGRAMVVNDLIDMGDEEVPQVEVKVELQDSSLPSRGNSANISSRSEDLLACISVMKRLPGDLLNSQPLIDAGALFKELVEYTKRKPSQDTSNDNYGTRSDSESEEERGGRSGAMRDEYAVVKRVSLTPSRIVVKSDNIVKTNRLIREFGNDYHIVYVHMCDEDGQSIHDKDIYEHRYKAMWEGGIKGLGLQGLELKLLLCSPSQMRNQTAVFLIGCSDDVTAILQSLIPKGRDNMSICKFTSRLGLFCTADYILLDLNLPGNRNVLKVAPVADILTVSGSNLTDGSAMISADLMRELSTARPDLFREDPMASFQFRMKGCKGVMTVHPSLTGRTIVLRESNTKFESPHPHLCFVKGAEYNTLKCNRDMLNLLFSVREEGVSGGDWEPLAVLLRIQEQELLRLAKSLINKAAAKKTLLAHSPKLSAVISASEERDVDITTEPHLRRCLLLLYEYSVRYLRTKTHIPIEKGALLMGIPDPYEVLEDGQIYVQIKKPGSCASEIITGPVLLYRNPCLHPGDLRIVTAVAHSALTHIYNEVVLPAKKGITRSLAAECSGGDLDGDQFGVVWDSRLIPPLNRAFPPMDYESIAKEIKEKAAAGEDDVVEQSQADHMVKGMCTPLGPVANMHQCISDQMPLGARDPLSMELAEQAAIAVDFPKTGVPPCIPSKAFDLVRTNGYPDQMEKADKAMYVSTKPIGIMYRDMMAKACELTLSTSTNMGEEIAPDEKYLTPDRLRYMAQAVLTYREYCDDVSLILLQFGLQSEVELVLGLPMHLTGGSGTGRYGTERDIKAQYEKIKRKYRKIFFSRAREVDEKESSGDDRMVHMASAWYAVAYGSGARKKKEGKGIADSWDMGGRITDPVVTVEDKQYLAFGWIMSDYITKPLTRTQNVPVEKVPSRSFQMYLGRELATHWKEISLALAESVKNLMPLLRRVEKAVSPCSVMLFGSVAQYLCDVYSDLDIYTALPKDNGEEVDAVVLPNVGDITVDFEMLQIDEGASNTNTNSDSVSSDYSLLDGYATTSATVSPLSPHSFDNTQQQFDDVIFRAEESVTHLKEQAVRESSFLNGVVAPMVGPIAVSKTNATSATVVPIIRLTLLGEGKRTVKADICARKDGVYKAMLMRKLYRRHPCFLPLFSLITEWARVQGVIRSASPNAAAGEVKTSSGDAEKVLMKSGFLHAITLYILMRGGKECRREEVIKNVQSEKEKAKGKEKGEKSTGDELLIQWDDDVSTPEKQPAKTSGADEEKDEDDDEEDKEGDDRTTSQSSPCAALSIASLNVEEGEEESNTVEGEHDYLSINLEEHSSQLAELLIMFFKNASLMKGDFSFIWPVPGKPEHVLPADVIENFAIRCAYTYQILAYSGSWTVILDNAGDMNEVSFSLPLPESINAQLQNCYEYVALKLQMKSKAREVRLVLNGSKFLLTAKGTRRQVQDLRSELYKLIRCGRVYGRLISSNTGAYFMQGSGMIFVKKSEDSSAVVRFREDLTDCMQGRNELTERTYVTLITEPFSDWRSQFIQAMIDKIREQLDLLDSEEPLDTMRLYVHFGRLYFMNSSNCFMGGEGCVGVSDLQDALDSSVSNRREYDRAEFDPQSIPLSYTAENESYASRTSSKSQCGEEKGKGESEGEGEGEGEENPLLRESSQDSTETSGARVTDISPSNSINAPTPTTSETVQTESVKDPFYEFVNDDDNQETKEHVPDMETPEAEKQRKERKGVLHCFQNTMFGRVIKTDRVVADLSTTLPGLQTFGDEVLLRGMGYTLSPPNLSVQNAAMPLTAYQLSQAAATPNSNLRSSDVIDLMNDFTWDDVSQGDVIKNDVSLGDVSKCDDSADDVSVVWQVTVVASANYQVEVSLNKSLRVVSVQERPLSWVSCTLLNGTEKDRQTPPCTAEDFSILKNHDARIKLASSKTIALTEDICSVTCPGGQAPITLDEFTQAPSPNLSLPESHRVTFAKMIMDRQTYSYREECSAEDFPLECSVNISKGYHFDGDNLENHQCVADMSLNFDIKPLIEYYRGVVTTAAGSPDLKEKVDRFLHKVLAHVVQLSDKIEEQYQREK